eukprot:CAMPEP_0174242904 /NCGR_PEP_ID=MMETSP0417-20130205/29584_1 /TAXON_ID=242541 /ORGANISM="Mayorella sp, Strain BSH-02190019" /LENGTH=689 /DNA_ID=CAMNT_0015322347 /DNA_START=67 /DNA_END=2133 /DNA_ORIENTATION=-
MTQNPTALAGILHAYQYRPRVENELTELFRAFPSLRAHEDVYVANDGRESMMVAVRGTIPISYRGAVYNIPIAIYLPPAFPSAHPIPLVTPVAGMRVKDNHPHVALSGECYLPYLSRWVASHSSLVGLVRSLQQLFAASPPVYAVPPGSQPAPTPHRPPPVSRPAAEHTDPRYHPVPQPTHPSAHLTPTHHPAYTQPPAHRLSSGSLHSLQSTPPRPTIEQKRAQLVKKLEERLSQEQKTMDTKMDACNEDAKALAESQQTLRRLRQTFTAAQQQQQRNLEQIQQADAVLAAQLLRLNEAQSGHRPADELVHPADPLSAQQMEAAAEVGSLDDLFYALDRSLQNDVITVDMYLQRVRRLAREQFFARALQNKVFTVQELHQPLPTTTSHPQRAVARARPRSSSTGGGAQRSWRLSQVLSPLPEPPQILTLVRGTQGQTTVWVATRHGSVLVYEPRTRQIVSRMPALSPGKRINALLQVGERVWACSDDNTVQVFSAESRNLVQQLRAHTAPVMAVCSSAFGGQRTTVFTASATGEVCAWTPEGQALARVNLSRGITCMCSCENYLVLGSERNILLLDGQLRGVCSWEAHHRLVKSLCSARTHVWSCSDDQSIKVWDVQNLTPGKSARCLKVFQPQRGRAFCLEYDGQGTVYAGFFDNSVMVHDANTLQVRDVLHVEDAHKDSVRALQLI